MKTIFIGALALLVLAGCASPTATPEKVRYVVVKNSLWETVKRIPIATSRELVTDDYTQEIEVYNSNNIDDFLRAYPEELVPDLAEAPPLDIFVCNPANYVVNSSAFGVSRADFVRDIELWRAEAQGQLLFIDHVPPPPIVIPPASMYAWYALYVVDQNGDIVYEDHCGWTVDEVWDGQWILDGGWRDADHYRETTRNAFWIEVTTHPGWTLVEHQLYTPPVTP